VNQQQARVISNEELATLVKIMRISNSWSQEQLAELTRLNVRTIQRVENGKGASFDTRRALAVAFESNDIDGFNKSNIFLKKINLNGYSIKYAKRKVTVNLVENTDEFTTWNLAYISIFPKHKAPAQFIVPRKVDFKIG